MTDKLQPWRLHGYFRSTAAWRVRIALHLKGLTVEYVSHHLRRGEQRAEEYMRLNPQGLVPALELADNSTVLTQSLAICEWLNEAHPSPDLLPGGAVERARIRAFALAIACDIHPVQNLGVLARLRNLGISDDTVAAWAHDVIIDGLTACHTLIKEGWSGPFLFGSVPTLADVCLVPQLFNARRFGVDLTPFSVFGTVEAACQDLAAFAAAVPEIQPDAE